ncbi:MAG: glycerol-3-phosphate acyltransferase [Clostridia bacterium]|nr:glycerol-3-phosphate acyltransferase [Clostridia bacterium]
MAFNEYIWWFLLIAVSSYLFGSVNTSITFSKLKKRDIRDQGSGNPGTLNMSRTFGMATGAMILVLDIFKGVIPTLIAGLCFDGIYFEGTAFEMSDLTSYLAGLFVVIGHIFPVYYGFKGGKGIATTIGVFAVGQQHIAWIFGILAIIFIVLTSIGSMGSFIATTPPAIYAMIKLYYKIDFASGVNNAELGYLIAVNGIILGIVFLTWFAHRQNIRKLLSGDEHTTDWLRMLKDRKLKKKKQTEGE